MIVIVGAEGQVGTAFRTLLGDDATYLSRDSFDLCDTETRIPQVLEPLDPDIIINCAAYTAVDQAEADFATAQTVNATAVGDLAAFAHRTGARFATFSTDHVFDGTNHGPYVESDLPNPLNVYGQTKRSGEIAALDVNPKTLVVRTSWVIAGSHRNFAQAILEATRKDTISVVNDQRGTPTIADDLAPAVLDAVHQGVEGMLHLTNQETVSRYELAREVLSIAGHDPERVRPCTTAEYPTIARRPENGALESERLDSLSLSPLPPYRAGLERAIRGIVEAMDREPWA